MGSLLDINKLGQKIWLDNLSRELFISGKLQDLINKGIDGITSNPSIFYKAISTDPLYQADLSRLKGSTLHAEECYEQIVIPDIQKACDFLKPVFENTNGESGYVSFEVSPYLANDAKATIENAKRLWQTIKRPNLMIKIPATAEGNKALEELIYEGININITLLFSLKQVLNTWEAYINGLNRRHLENRPINTVKAVASFFLSRIDSYVDDKLPASLQGKTAINLAKTAYLIYKETFNSEVFKHLRESGATPQRLLFASTGTKNPQYSDVLYVEELIGPETINTVPDATLALFLDHGQTAPTLNKDIEQAPLVIEKIKELVDLEMAGEQLQQDGLKLFEDSFNSLIQLMLA